MTTHDDRVERVARAIGLRYVKGSRPTSEIADRWWRLLGEDRQDDLMAAARAAISALDAEPPLEDVLQQFAATRVACDEEGTDWSASVAPARRWGGPVADETSHGVGPTIDAAIRDAVQNAKEAT